MLVDAGQRLIRVGGRPRLRPVGPRRILAGVHEAVIPRPQGPQPRGACARSGGYRADGVSGAVAGGAVIRPPGRQPAPSLLRLPTARLRSASRAAMIRRTSVVVHGRPTICPRRQRRSCNWAARMIRTGSFSWGSSPRTSASEPSRSIAVERFHIKASPCIDARSASSPGALGPLSGRDQEPRAGFRSRCPGRLRPYLKRRELGR